MSTETRILTDDDLDGLVTTDDLIAALRAVHIDQALGRAEQPVPMLTAAGPDTVLLPMIATSHRLGLTAVKILTDARASGPADGPAQQSTIVVLDAHAGARRAVLTGGRITRGTHRRRHRRGHRRPGPPRLPGPRVHVNAVGAPPRPDHRESDSAGMARATVVVDDRAIQLAKSGEVLPSIADGVTTAEHFGVELGAVLARQAPERTSAEEVTLFTDGAERACER